MKLFIHKGACDFLWNFVQVNVHLQVNLSCVTNLKIVCYRDFVYLRHWEQSDGWYITSSVSTEYSAMPQERKFVRGEQGPSVIRMKDLTSNKLRLEWLLNTNLKVRYTSY